MLARVLGPLAAALLIVGAPGCAQPTQRVGAETKAARTACAARGGVLEPRGRLRTPVCVVRYADAGKTCRGKRDCRGLCLAPDGEGQVGDPARGTCQPDNTRFGCRAEVEGGRISTPVLCVD